MIGQITAIAFVLGLLLLALFLLKRKGLATFNLAVTTREARRARQLRVLERVPLTPNHSLHLVRFQDRVLLIGVSPSGCAQLDCFPGTALAAQEGESA